MMSPSLTSNPTEATIETWLINWTAEQLDLEKTEIDINQSFLNYDMNSVTVMMLVGDLEDWLGLSLSPTLAWDYPDIKTLAQYLAQEANKVESNGHKDINNTQQILNQLDDLSEEETDALLNQLLAES
ncbi:MAG: acyl carrier protein [Crocosphaera sp.]|nr:acyl carrier protein [Crocosphaera sp.]